MREKMKIFETYFIFSQLIHFFDFAEQFLHYEIDVFVIWVTVDSEMIHEWHHIEWSFCTW